MKQQKYFVNFQQDQKINYSSSTNKVPKIKTNYDKKAEQSLLLLVDMYRGQDPAGAHSCC